MQLYYFNDRTEPITVQVKLATRITIVPPNEARIFNVEIPDGYILFVKCWEYKVLLTAARIPDEPNPET
jgi:hypothetical protein